MCYCQSRKWNFVSTYHFWSWFYLVSLLCAPDVAHISNKLVLPTHSMLLSRIRLAGESWTVALHPVINILLLLCLIDRHHPGDDQRDTGIDGKEDAGRHSGTAETGRGGQPAGLSGGHAGTRLFPSVQLRVVRTICDAQLSRITSFS